VLLWLGATVVGCYCGWVWPTGRPTSAQYAERALHLREIVLHAISRIRRPII